MLFRATRVPCTATSGFDWNDVDFLLFRVTTEEIRWLQSFRVVVPRVTHLPLGRRRHLRSMGETRTSFSETVIATSPSSLA